MWDIVANLSGLAGIACLAVPAWHANKYGRLVARLNAASSSDLGEDLSGMQRQAIDSLKELQAEWTAWKGNLLIVGTILAGISYAIPLLKSALDHVVLP